MTANVKTGLRNPLDEAQVRKAVLALQEVVAAKTAALPKQPLVSSVEYVSAIITRRLVPAKGSLKPIQINIPHSMRGGENDAEMCLIVKTEDKARIKAALAADPVPGLAKVMDLKKLQKNFKRFEDRRTLAGAYDLFLVDDRILPYLPKALGSKFFVQKKQPVPVRVSRKNVAFGVRAIYRSTQMVVSTGACTNVKVAHLGMSVDEIVENIIVAMNNCASHIPKGWNGVQSISIKTNESVALPIYNSLAPLAKLPPMPKKVALAKRKLEEADVDTTPKTPAKKAKKEEPVAKKAKKTEAATEVPSKKVAKKEDKKDESKKAVKKEVAAPAETATPSKKEGKKDKKTKESKKEEVVAPVKKDKKAKESKKEEAVPAKKDKKVKETKKEEVVAPVKESKKESKKEVASPAKKEKKEAKKSKKEAAVAASPAKKSKKVTADAPQVTKVRKEKKKKSDA